MRTIKELAKNATAHVLYFSGLADLWLLLTLRNRCVVLMYHRVLADDQGAATASHPGIVVSKRSFDTQLAALKRRMNVLTLAAFADHMVHRRPFPGRSCLITFDDGWLDNLDNALPILRKHGLPACLFLPVAYVGSSRLFWRERLCHCLVAVSASARAGTRLSEPLLRRIERLGLAGLMNSVGRLDHRRVVDAVSTVPAALGSEAEALLEGLRGELPTPDNYGPDRFITWEQAAELVRQGVAVGSHGSEHVLLDAVAAADAEADVLASSKALAERLDESAVRAFSYPNGAFNRGVADIVKKAGFDVAFTTRPGFVSSADDRYSIARVNIHEDASASTPLFLARLLGLM